MQAMSIGALGSVEDIYPASPVSGCPNGESARDPALQVVVLGGLYGGQTRGTPVRPVQLISTSYRNVVAGLQSAGW